MSVRPCGIQLVPQITALATKAEFPKGNIYMKMRDALGTIYQEEDFTDLYPKDGQPAIPPWRLALVTVMQFVES